MKKMKKFYSILLMATALLISANVKAATVSVTTADQLYEALANGEAGKVIELGNDIT